MHVAAVNPAALDEGDVDPAMVEKDVRSRSTSRASRASPEP